MDPDHAQEISERDQLWANLRALRPAIDRFAAGELASSEHDRQLAVVFAKIVAAEMDFRVREAPAE